MLQNYDLPTFLGVSVPVELVSELLDIKVEGNSVIMRCSTLRYEPELVNYYGTRCETVLRPPTTGQPATVRVDFCTPDVLRLRYAPGDAVPENQTPMVVGEYTAPVPLVMREEEFYVTIFSAGLRLVVDREPWQLQVFDQRNEMIFCTKPVDIDGLRRPDAQWNPPEQRWLFLHRYAYPLGCARHGDVRKVFASFDLHYDERIYGFGESYGRLDKRGTPQRLWLQEGFGNASPASYKQTPFYLSTRGYGLFANTSNAVGYHVGSLEHTALSLTVDDANFLDLYLFAGPNLADILPRYTALTGAPAVPPLWSFGLWMGRISYNSQEEVEEVAAELRQQQVPCDVIHIDTEWFDIPYGGDLRFNRERFPDPAAMCTRLREMGFRICLWQWPNLQVGTPIYAEGVERGTLVKRRTGWVFTFPGFLDDAALIDYSNPEAVAWMQEKFRELFGLGVAAIKVDFGEGAPPDARYHSVASESMHNRYPLLYNQAIFEVTKEATGDGIVWARSAWAGSQRYPVHWSGDGVARFEDLACVLRSALSFGLSGFPFYSHDIGGFSGLPDSDLYVRWAQLAFFSSHVRAHGTPPREPWEFGDHAAAIFRQYAELRYRLLPYIYSEALECGRSSLPMLRPLVLDFQDDPTTHGIDDQYLFGRSLLVAPILDERNSRCIYLPEGTWIDFWQKQVVPGGTWLTVDAPLEVLPLFVRAGAILPFGPVVQHSGVATNDPLTLEIYAPELEGFYQIEHPDREPINVVYRRTNDSLLVLVTGAPGEVEVKLYGAKLRLDVEVQS
ncbi:MAG: DUF4968 domain-containing protein [Chloroflexaceae bacterium]|nr:DUF4968 domain-containing protein [Chloroflexaceae bacterium]